MKTGDLKKIESEIADNYDNEEETISKLLSIFMSSSLCQKLIESRFSEFPILFEQENGEELFFALSSQQAAYFLFKNEVQVQKWMRNTKNLSAGEKQSIVDISKRNWTFSVSILIEDVGYNFYKMVDIFSEEEYLLYSGAMSEHLADHGVLTWFSLRFNNGKCWETYGPVIGYRSFDEDDIMYFATELYQFESENKSLSDLLNDQPLGFQMLSLYALDPIMISQGKALKHNCCQLDLLSMDPNRFLNDFVIQEEAGVTRLELISKGSHPDFAVAYFEKKKRCLYVTSMTDEGYESIQTAFAKYGILVPESEYRVGISMIRAAENILDTMLPTSPLESLFVEENIPTDQKDLETATQLLSLVMEDINLGIEPNIENIARESDLPYEEALELLTTMVFHIKRTREYDRD